jgi:hypothetical protein
MKLRSAGIAWLQGRLGDRVGPVHVSRFYPPDKSWTKQAAWAFEIPLHEIDGPNESVYLVYQLYDAQHEFGYLRIPTAFLQQHRRELFVRRDNEHVSLFLSAEPHERLRDKRGRGGVEFSSFEYDGRS